MEDHHSHNHVYQDDDLDDDDENDDSEPLNGAVPDDDDPVDSDSSSDTDDADITTTTTTTTVASVTVAIPSSIAPPSTSAVTVALPDPKRQRFDSTPPPLSSSTSIVPVVTPTEKKPIDDSRRLFQRLWTDEDEIELLQGFLEYTASRGTTSSGHHHDTAAFYDQIKSKLQLEFNKNQLVEKLRRLKKKYRNVLSKMSTGKEFVFKSPHDQATFEISRKIWSNLASNHRNTVEFDDDEQQNPNPNPSLMAATQSPSSGGGGFVISHINLNNAATLSGGGDHKPPSNFDLMASPAISAAAKLSSRKRPRVGSVSKMEDKFVRVNLQGGSGGGVGEGVGGGNVNTNTTNNSNSNNININSSSSNVNVGPAMQGLIEETVRNCLSPMFKELINNAMNGGFKGVGALAMNAAPLSFGGINMGSGGGEIIDEKWRNQQILELEVYSKRLELVQEQIKQTLDELRSMGS